MKTTNIVCLLILATLITAQSNTLQVLNVSSSPSTVERPVITSLRGGELIYIKIIGHNPIASQNLVYVGTFPCIIPSDGVSDTYIACMTTDTGSRTNIDNMPITVISYGTAFTTSYPNSVYFRDYKTPQLT